MRRFLHLVSLGTALVACSSGGTAADGQASSGGTAGSGSTASSSGGTTSGGTTSGGTTSGGTTSGGTTSGGTSGGAGAAGAGDPIKVLFVGLNGCNNNEYVDSKGFVAAMSTRVHAEIGEYLVAGGNEGDPTHFFKNPDYFQKENGTGASFNYDVIVYSGANGCSTNAVEDVDALVQAHNGVRGAKPAMFLRASHYFAKGWNEKYRELLGIGSRDHDIGQAGTVYSFPNPTDPVVSALNTSEQHFGTDDWMDDNAGGMSLYYNDGGFYGDNLSVLVKASKLNNYSYTCWCSQGPESQAIAWKYNYSNNLSSGTGVHPRMFAHTYYSKSGNIDDEMSDIIAGALVWVTGK